MQIFSLGGGEIAENETLPIDRLIVRATGKRDPKVLFVPTASGDAVGYCENFENLYGETLGCPVRHLLLYEDQTSKAAAYQMILESDLIYVGGGNTKKLMQVWSDYGITDWLREAALNGCVMAGLSAGAICWYEWGFSDSERFLGTEDWRFGSVEGLGWLGGMYCPHLDVEQRLGPLVQHIIKTQEGALACDNGVALHWVDGSAKVVSSFRNAYAYKLVPSGQQVIIHQYAHGETVK